MLASPLILQGVCVDFDSAWPAIMQSVSAMTPESIEKDAIVHLLGTPVPFMMARVDHHGCCGPGCASALSRAPGSMRPTGPWVPMACLDPHRQQERVHQEKRLLMGGLAWKMFPDPAASLWTHLEPPAPGCHVVEFRERGVLQEGCPCPNLPIGMLRLYGHGSPKRRRKFPAWRCVSKGTC